MKQGVLLLNAKPHLLSLDGRIFKHSQGCVPRVVASDPTTRGDVLDTLTKK
jgi:hypothetical protein